MPNTRQALITHLPPGLFPDKRPTHHQRLAMLRAILIYDNAPHCLTLCCAPHLQYRLVQRGWASGTRGNVTKLGLAACLLIGTQRKL